MNLRRRLAIFFFIIAFLPALLISTSTYSKYRALFEADAFLTLTDIAVYKAEKIDTYFANIKNEIAATQASWCIKRNLPILNKFANQLNSPEFLAAKDILDERFRPMQQAFGFVDIILLHPDGRIAYGSNPKHLHRSNSMPDPGQLSFAKGRSGICITGIFRNPHENYMPCMIVSAPMHDNDGSFIGLVAFELNVQFIYNMLQEKTGLGSTGETIIGQKIGNEVLFLSPLKEKPDAALRRRVGIGSKVAHPMQNAVLGGMGSGYSIDYRGKNVMAAWRHIPSLDWGLVVKIDNKEAFQDLETLKNAIIAILALLFVLALGIAYTISFILDKVNIKLNNEILKHKKTSEELTVYKEHLEELVARRTEKINDLQKQIEYILGATKTGLDIIDSDYNVIYMDPEWQKVYGDPSGKKCYEYFMGRNQVCPNCGVTKAFQTKKPVIAEEILAKEGNRPIQVTTIPYQDANGKWFVAEVNVDITERKKAEVELERYRIHLEDLVKERSEEVRKAKDMLEFQIKRMPIGCIMWDMDFKVIGWNPEAERIFGYSASEAMGKHPYEFIVPLSAQPQVDKVWSELLNGSDGAPSTNENVTKDGRTIICQWTNTPIKMDGGEILSVMSMVQDVTERINSEKSLQEAFERIQNLNDNITDGMVYQIVRNKDGSRKFTYLSDSVQKLYGCSPTEAIKNPNLIYGKVHEDDRETLFEEEEKASRSLSVFKMEARINYPPGNTRWSSFVSKPKKMKDGSTVWDGIEFDITDIKHAEAALEISEANYRSIFELASDAILVRDIETYEIVDANQQACALLCYPKEELIGTKPDQILPGKVPYNWQYMRPIFNKAAGGEQQSVEMMLKDKAGRTFWVESHIKRAVIGGIYRMISIAHDISDRKESEKKISALNNSITKANEELKRLALIDSHTGLYNFHYYGGMIEAEFSRAQRQGERLSLIMMDIDYFKSINDVYGHEFGDIVLKQFADILKNTVRLYDIVIRFGGEEFIIIAPGTGNREALNLAKRILSAVNGRDFGNTANQVKLKVSAAVGSYPDDPHITKSADFLTIADDILNRAKEEGGNRAYSSLDIKLAGIAIELKEEDNVKSLKDKIQKLTTRGNQSVAEAIFAFAKTIELKDHYTGEHVDDTMHYARLISERLGLPEHTIETVKYAAALHDLGKVGIPESILHKKDKLSDEEYDNIKRHPQIGADIVRPIHFLHEIIPAIVHHHERWDGAGYPHGLKGEAIPLGARIVAVADAYQAMISDRPYRKAYTVKKTMEILKDNSGTQFDPKVVKTFIEILQNEDAGVKQKKKA
jgi:diguanylate cyclase (GGDEF)-like protein/PAS domain S-box-containing protein